MNAIDWTPLYKKYKGQWVALANDEKTVLASADTVSQAIRSASKKSKEKPILFKVPKKNITYVGYGNGNKLQLQAN